MADPNSGAIAANSRGVAALHRNDFAAAAAAFDEAVAFDPSSGALLRNLASARRALGDDSGELAAVDAALAIDRRDLVAWVRKAELHQRRDERGAALAGWQAALALAEPLRPWSGPLAELLLRGEAYSQSAIAAIDAAAGKKLKPILAKMDPAETRRGQAFVDLALGRRTLFHNHCSGLCYPFLPADEFFDDSHFPWFADFAAATSAIRSELEQLLADPGDSLRPYVRMEAGTPSNPWSPLDHTLDWAACFLWEYGEPNPAVLDRCPATVKALAAVPAAAIPGRSPTAFFSVLQPHTRIPPHTGVTNTRAIVHLPLIVPAGCGFRVGGETRAWEEGKPFAFDDTIEHEAWNDSDVPRAVLICDVWNPHLSERERDMVTRYYAAADSTGFNPAKSE